jgi:hypothetical protein
MSNEKTTTAVAPSKSSKFNNAVERATGTNPAGTEIEQVDPTGGIAAMMRPFDAAAMHAKLATGKYEAAPQLVSLKPGQEVTGILEGNGPVAEFTDAATGEITEVKTWIIADPTGSLRISILSSAQLDRKLNGFIGGEVTIGRGPDVNIGGGKRMTEYMVIGPKLAGGQRRQWFDVPNETRMLAERSSASNGASNPHHAEDLA